MIGRRDVRWSGCRSGCRVTAMALWDANHFNGGDVVLSARIANEARGSEILVSSVLKELTGITGSVWFGRHREPKLRGLDGPHRVVSVACGHLHNRNESALLAPPNELPRPEYDGVSFTDRIDQSLDLGRRWLRMGEFVAQVIIPDDSSLT
jgi:hypothetical protein